MRDIGSLVRELRRRRVFRVAIVYAAVGWVLIQAASVIGPALHLPPWTTTFIVVLVLLGFPVALVLAWAFEVTPEGIRRSSAAVDAAKSSAEAVSPRAPWKRVAWVAGLAVLAVGAGWTLWHDRASSTGEASSTAVAVLPFSVRGSEELAYLGEGMVSLLSTKLDGAGELRTVDPRALLSQVSERGGNVADPSEGRAIAERFGAGWFVMGDILEVGGRIRMTATLYDGRNGTRVVEGTVEGASSEIFSLVDQVAAQLLAGFEGGPAARIDRIAAVTTSSLPALKAYLEGQTALRNGDYEAAVDAFQRAVAEDSTFALGYYRLSIAAEWLLRWDLSHEAAQRAFQYADRLSDRDRALLEAFSAFRRGETERAETLYRSMVGAHPDDVDAWLYLGELLFHGNPARGRSPVEAKEPFLRILELEPGNTGALVHLARLAAMERNVSELDGYVHRYVELTPSADRHWPMRALQAFSHNDRAEQDRLIQALERVASETLILVAWDTAVYLGDVRAAERVARLLIEPWRPAEERALGHVYLAHYVLAQGRWREARALLEGAEGWNRAFGVEYRALLSSLSFVPSSPEDLRAVREDLRAFDAGSVPDAENPETFFAVHNGLHPLIKEYLLGLVSARLGEREAAEAHARRVAATGVPVNLGTLPSDLALGIRSHLARQENRPKAALDALQQARFQINYQSMIASAFVSMAYERFTRAELLHELGRDGEALDWYRNTTTASTNEIVYRALSHLRQAQILERRGDRESAIRNYRAFLDLWHAADPELQPLVAEARSALERLTSLER